MRFLVQLLAILAFVSCGEKPEPVRPEIDPIVDPDGGESGEGSGEESGGEETTDGQRVSLQAAVTEVQPMTGIVLWNTSGSKTKGYVLATSKSTVADIGDEPLQMKRKFGKVHVAVDADRCEGIERLTSDDTTSNTEVILLDDAYQHRYVKPGINILLVDYHRLISYDRLLPAGRLREPREGKNRADIVIVTKCPTTMKPMDYRVVTRNLDLYPYQTLLFSHLRYGDLHPMYCGDDRRLDSLGANEHVLLLTGIAQPQQMMMDMEVYCKHITPMTFADHHAYTPEDIERINSTYASLPEPRLIITTEKDAARLHGMEGLTDDVRHHMYTLPVRVEFLNDNAETFHNKIFTYLKKDVEKSGLVRRQQAEREAQAAKENNGKKSPDKPRTISF